MENLRVPLLCVPVARVTNVFLLFSYVCASLCFSHTKYEMRLRVATTARRPFERRAPAPERVCERDDPSVALSMSVVAASARAVKRYGLGT